MTEERFAKSLALLVLFASLLLAGCDRFHKASVIVDPRIFKAEAEMASEAMTEKFTLTVKEFSSKLHYDCRPMFQPPDILECGPAWHRKITLYRKDDRFIITLFEMHPGWGDSPYFCSVQGQMFEYFSQKFGEANVKTETNDSCGRKNHP